MAITEDVARRERQYIKPPLVVEAFGESKSVTQWRDDSRVVVKMNVFVRRIQHGWSPEAAFTTPLSGNRGRKEGSGPLYELFDEAKTIREWAQDERCAVSEMTLRKNIQSGMPLAEAFEFRRRPGRNLGAGKEDFGREIDGTASVLKMIADQGELWVYETTGVRRISLIHRDVRHVITEETFNELLSRQLIVKSFQTDTITNYELSPAGKVAVA